MNSCNIQTIQTLNIYNFPSGKSCSKCRIFKPFNDYHKDRRSNDVLRSDCKSCHLALEKPYKPRRQELWRNRYYSDEEFRFKKLLRGRLYSVLNSQGVSKFTNTMYLVGCSPEWLTLWLHFTKNYYYPCSINIHIDHLRPCSSFDLTDPEEQYDCFSWRNLRAIDSQENLSKNARYPTDTELCTQQRLIYSFRDFIQKCYPEITY